MRSFLFAFAVGLGACGSPQAGGSCDTTGFLCADSTNALECQVGKWVALPCRGPSGCQREGSTIKCDMSANVEGDACASSAVGSGLCSTDGKATLECRSDPMTGSNKLKKTNVCRSCSVKRNTATSKDEVVCEP